MALTNACNTSATVKNTGSECSASLKATAQIILAPKKTIITAADLLDFTQKVVTMSHAAKSLRWYCLFGTAAPINVITDKTGTDVIETLDDGSSRFIRYDMFERTFATTDGGACLAESLQSFIGNAYGFIEVDITGQVKMMDNGDGTYSPFPVNLHYSPTPDLGNFKTTYKNKFLLNFNPIYYIGKGKVFASDIAEDLIDTTGLIDTDIVNPGTAATQSTTNIFFNVLTDCAATDLATLYGGTGTGAIGQITNFSVKLSVTPFTVITPSAVTIIPATLTAPAQVKLTGTYVSGSSYVVAGTSAATWLANGVEGYEAIKTVTVTIP